MRLIESRNGLFVAPSNKICLTLNPGQPCDIEGILTADNFELFESLVWFPNEGEEPCIDAPRLSIIWV